VKSNVSTTLFLKHREWKSFCHCFIKISRNTCRKFGERGGNTAYSSSSPTLFHFPKFLCYVYVYVPMYLQSHEKYFAFLKHTIMHPLQCSKLNLKFQSRLLAILNYKMVSRQKMLDARKKRTLCAILYDLYKPKPSSFPSLK